MKRQSKSLDVGKVIEEFTKAEGSNLHRRDAFKIEGHFEDAVRKIAKAKPQHNKPDRHA